MYLVENLTETNAVRLMISAYLVNHNLLFHDACQFIIENQFQNNIQEAEDWKDLEQKNPALALKIRAAATFQF